MTIPSMTSETMWVVIGFAGQSFFFMRFFWQWLASEKAGDSVIPKSFWYYSLGGGITLFVYALHRHDPVFIMGQSTGLFIYVRNLYLIRRKNTADAIPQT